MLASVLSLSQVILFLGILFNRILSCASPAYVPLALYRLIPNLIPALSRNITLTFLAFQEANVLF